MKVLAVEVENILARKIKQKEEKRQDKILRKIDKTNRVFQRTKRKN